jgi:hypothetical protein
MGPVNMRLTQSVLEMVGLNTIATDGSESRAVFAPDGDGHRISPVIAKDDGEFVHDDFSGYQAGKKGTLETASGFRMKKTGKIDPDPTAV